MRFIGLNMCLGRQGVDHWIPGIKWGGCKNEDGVRSTLLTADGCSTSPTEVRGCDDDPEFAQLTVISGSGSGRYRADSVRQIQRENCATGETFSDWTWPDDLFCPCEDGLNPTVGPLCGLPPPDGIIGGIGGRHCVADEFSPIAIEAAGVPPGQFFAGWQGGSDWIVGLQRTTQHCLCICPMVYAKWNCGTCWEPIYFGNGPVPSADLFTGKYRFLGGRDRTVTATYRECIPVDLSIRRRENGPRVVVLRNEASEVANVELVVPTEYGIEDPDTGRNLCNNFWGSTSKYELDPGEEVEIRIDWSAVGKSCGSVSSQQSLARCCNGEAHLGALVPNGPYHKDGSWGSGARSEEVINDYLCGDIILLRPE